MKRTKKQTSKIKFKKGTIAISQILILVIGIFAISWMIGSEIEEMSAAGDITTSDGCASNYICSYNKLYPGQLVGGKCIADRTKSGTDCPDGCTDGSLTCTLNVNSNDGGFGEDVKKTATALAAPIGADLAKDEIKSLLAHKATAKLGSAAEKTAADIAYEKAYETTLASTGDYNAAVAAGKTAGDSVINANLAKTGKYTLGKFLFGTTTKTTVNGVTTTSWIGVGGNSAVGAIVVWSAIAFVMGRYVIGRWIGLNTQQSQALGYALAAGTFAGLFATSHAILGAGTAVGGPLGLAIGATVAFVMFMLLGKKSSIDVIQYTCSQWDAKSGKGMTEAQKKQACKICNDQKDLVCTEYQCKSLGQGCVLINEESSGRQLCIWNDTRDILPPVITPWKEALLTDFKYNPDNTISPPDKGVKIAYTGKEDVTMDGTTKCAPAFTPISFGVQLNEPAKCKISPQKLTSYAEMADVYMGRGIRDYNQSFVLSLPSKEAMEAENITADNGGKYQLFVRCEDSNGNSNTADFVFKFCISEGPDTTPPLIIGTSILDNQPIAYGQKSINLELYVNEPAECRWSRLDKNYEAMEENMTCAKNVSEINAAMLYTCKTTLTGLKDSEANKFYFRCKDQPNLQGTPKENKRNANTQSYPLTLMGTKPLVIEEVGPTGIIEDSTDVIKVNLTAQTAAGYDEGKAMCSFSETESPGSYIDFFYGYDIEPFSQYQHSQELWLEEGNYTYFIQCRDKGGNIDNKNVSFRVETDTSPPIVVRVYKEDDYIKLITDEPGKCVYSNFGCTYLFDDGTEMTSLNDKEYYAEWNINTDFYIKCKDDYGNMPLPNVCSIIARPFEIFALQ
jgi:hypothetical protein